MIGTGSVVLSHIDGWSACREAVMDMEFFMNPDKTAKRTLVVTLTKPFTCVGELKGNVKGMFSYDAGNKTAFSGFMIGKSKVQITGELNNDFETIIKEIKNGKVHT